MVNGYPLMVSFSYQPCSSSLKASRVKFIIHLQFARRDRRVSSIERSGRQVSISKISGRREDRSITADSFFHCGLSVHVPRSWCSGSCRSPGRGGRESIGYRDQQQSGSYQLRINHRVEGSISINRCCC